MNSSTKLISLLATLVLLAMPVSKAQAASYDIDLSHSAIVFKAGHLGIGWVIGRFNSFEGSYEYDPAAPASAQSAKVVIDTTSIDSNHPERDRHLANDDYLNVSEFATATFVSTAFTGDKTGGTLSGDLTLLGKTAPISIEVKFTGEGKDPWGGYRSGFSGTTTLNLVDFGLITRVIKTVDIDIYLEGIRQ